MLPHLFFLAALTGPGPVHGAPHAVPAAAQERESLQELLERMRRQRDAYLAGLEGRVNEILAGMLEEAGSEGRGLATFRDQLVALGPEAAPLYVRAIDPGAAPDDPARIRARHVARALREVPNSAVTNHLLQTARRASKEGRRNAVWVLGTTPDAAKASVLLVELYRGEEGDLREEVLSALATLGGKANLEVLGEALREEDERLVRTALSALTEAGSAEVAPQVLALLQAPEKARVHVNALLAYYKRCPSAVNTKVLKALIGVASDLDASAEDRIRVLEELPAYGDKLSSDLKRDVRDLADSGNRRVAEGALVASALMGDTRSRKELLRDYDDRVKRNPDWSRSYAERAEIYYRIGDDRNAIRDFKQALKLAERRTREDHEDIYVGIARACARSGRDKEAYRYLRDGPMSIAKLRALGEEPVFAELREHSRYGDVFHLDEE